MLLDDCRQIADIVVLYPYSTAKFEQTKPLFPELTTLFAIKKEIEKLQSPTRNYSQVDIL
jgi:hypothetical protein